MRRKWGGGGMYGVGVYWEGGSNPKTNLKTQQQIFKNVINFNLIFFHQNITTRNPTI